MTDRKTNAEILAELDNCENAVTRSVLKDVCVSRLRDVVEDGGWQPIETAPDNRTVWVSYKNRADMRRIAKATRHAPPLHEDAPLFEGCTEQEDGTILCPLDWYEEHENECPICGEGWTIQIDDSPTHWMPLPEPPENQS